MAAPKRTEVQRERDLLFIEPLLARATPYVKIAELLSSERGYDLTDRTISRDARTLMKRWRDEAVSDVALMKARELKRLEAVEAEAWRAFERSCEPAVKTTLSVAPLSPATVDASDEGISAGRGRRECGKKETQTRDGDPRFLSIVILASSKRVELLGLGDDLLARIEDLEKKL